MADLLLDNDAIRSGFAKQYCAALLGSGDFGTNMTGGMAGKVMRGMLPALELAIHFYARSETKLRVLINYLMFHNRFMQQRSMNNRLYWTEGDFTKYRDLSRDQYSHILQLARADYDKPYNHIHFCVLLHKMEWCIKINGCGLVIASTSGQEHSQKLEKGMYKSSSNYDYDETVRLLHLYGPAFGLESVIYLENDLTLLKEENLKSETMWYTVADHAEFEEVIKKLPSKAKKIYKRLKAHKSTKQFKW